MREFFRGWRRKAGVVLLGLACVLMVGWIRSLTGFETGVAPTTGLTAVGVVSTDGHILLVVHQFTSAEFAPPFPYWVRDRFQAIDKSLTNGPENVVDLRVCRIGLISLKSDHTGSLVLMAPYWSIVIPLTLLSALLLLWPQRKWSQTPTVIQSPQE